MTSEKYFKSRIDWKYYNYLIYNITDLEDNNDVHTEVSVFLWNKIDGDENQYLYYNGKYMELDYPIEVLEKWYENVGICYTIYIYIYIVDLRIQDLFWNKIESRSTLLENGGDGLVVQPKNEKDKRIF